MTLTSYQSEKFKSIEKLPINVWFIIEPSRKDRDELIEALKLYIDIFGNILEFNEHYTKFRRIEPYEDIDGITIKFEFHKREDVFIDYSHLPDPIFKDNSKTKKRHM